MSLEPCPVAVEAHNQSPIQLTIVQLLREILKKEYLSDVPLCRTYTYSTVHFIMEPNISNVDLFNYRSTPRES
jgi:hypothetical protein